MTNPSAAATDYVRVEFRTAVMDGSRRRVDAPPMGPTSMSSVEHLGSICRITRVTLAPGDSVTFAAPDAEPALLLLVSSAKVEEGVGTAPSSLAAGDTRFVPPGSRHMLRNVAETSLQLLRFDVLTPPVK